MKTLQKKKRCCFLCYESVVEDINVRQRVKSQNFELETFFVKENKMENIAD